MEERTATITLRIEPSLKAGLEKLAAEQDLTSSQLIRAYIRHIVTDHMAKTRQPELDLGGGKKPKRGEKIAQAWKQQNGKHD